MACTVLPALRLTVQLSLDGFTYSISSNDIELTFLSHSQGGLCLLLNYICWYQVLFRHVSKYTQHCSLACKYSLKNIGSLWVFKEATAVQGKSFNIYQLHGDTFDSHQHFGGHEKCPENEAKNDRIVRRS